MLIYNLPTDIRQIALHEYEQNKRNTISGYTLRWFGLYRLYTKDYGLFIVFCLSLAFIVPGIIRWIIDGLKVSDFIKNKNKELDGQIYMKYKH